MLTTRDRIGGVDKEAYFTGVTHSSGVEKVRQKNTPLSSTTLTVRSTSFTLNSVHRSLPFTFFYEDQNSLAL